MPVSSPTLVLTHAAILSSSGRNFLSTSELIRLPDDCTVGYIIECKVGGQLLPNALFHSHLENLQLIPPSRLTQQVRRGNGARGRCVRKERWRRGDDRMIDLLVPLTWSESVVCSFGEAFLTNASLKYGADVACSTDASHSAPGVRGGEGAHVWGVMGGLRASLWERGTRTSRNDDLLGKGLGDGTMSALCGEITRRVGGLERQRD